MALMGQRPGVCIVSLKDLGKVNLCSLCCLCITIIDPSFGSQTTLTGTYVCSPFLVET